jgi:hypothetical protein
MKRTFAVLIGLALVLASPTAVAQKPPRYQGYVVCSSQMAAPPAAECGQGKPMIAVFLSKDRDVTLKICVTYPDKTRLCAKHQHATKGVKRINDIGTVQLGRHKVTWSAGGDTIATWVIRVHD